MPAFHLTASHATSQSTHSSECDMGYTLSTFDSALPLGRYQNCFGHTPYDAHNCVLTNTYHGCTLHGVSKYLGLCLPLIVAQENVTHLCKDRAIVLVLAMLNVVPVSLQATPRNQVNQVCEDRTAEHPSDIVLRQVRLYLRQCLLEVVSLSCGICHIMCIVIATECVHSTSTSSKEPRCSLKLMCPQYHICSYKILLTRNLLFRLRNLTHH